MYYGKVLQGIEVYLWVVVSKKLSFSSLGLSSRIRAYLLGCTFQERDIKRLKYLGNLLFPHLYTSI